MRNNTRSKFIWRTTVNILTLYRFSLVLPKPKVSVSSDTQGSATLVPILCSVGWEPRNVPCVITIQNKKMQRQTSITTTSRPAKKTKFTPTKKRTTLRVPRSLVAIPKYSTRTLTYCDDVLVTLTAGGLATYQFS